MNKRRCVLPWKDHVTALVGPPVTEEVPISQGHSVHRGGDPDSRTLDSGPQGCGVLSSSHEMRGKIQNLQHINLSR